MDWLKFCLDNYKAGNYNLSDLKVFVVKNKITPQGYKDITGDEYEA
jgi:L-rhamnose isomerase